MRGFGLNQGQYEDPALMPDHLRRLHKKVVAAKRAEPAREPAPTDVDETGRAWRGLVETDPTPQPNSKEQHP